MKQSPFAALAILSLMLPFATVTRAQNGTNVLDATIKGLYQAKQYPAIVGLLQSTVTQTDDPKYRALLALAALRTGNRVLAQEQLTALSASQNDAAKAYAPKLTEDLRAYDEAIQRRDTFLKAVSEHRRQDALQQAADLALPDSEKQQIELYLTIFDGDYGAARKQLEMIAADKDSGFDAVTVGKQIDTLDNTYATLLKTIQDDFIYSPNAVSYCDSSAAAADPRLKDVISISVLRYEGLVSQLNATAPLSDAALDLLFHAQLLLGKYSDLEKLGDAILAAKGQIRIPFYSKDSFFRLVIDSKNHVLYTESDPHHFHANLAVHSFGRLLPSDVNNWNSAVVPFKVDFSEIKTISQNGGASNTGIGNGDYALRVDGSGTAPHFALMHTMGCTQGSVAIKTATHDLGQYIVHVINNPRLKAALQDTKAPSKFAHALATYGGMAAVGAVGAYDGAAMESLAGQAISTINHQDIQRGMAIDWTKENQAVLETVKPMSFASPAIADHFRQLIDSLGIN